MTTTNEHADVALLGAIADSIDEGFAKGAIVAVAYVDEKSRPHLSFRASTRVYASDELGIWIHDPNGGFLRAVAKNPEVALLFRDGEVRTTLQFQGRARIATDEATRNAVFDAAPELERNLDPERLGGAVIVQIDSLTGRLKGEILNMQRR